MTKNTADYYSNIRQKSRFVELFPWIGGGTSTTVYPYVYLSREVYRNVFSKHPDPYKISTLIHEQEHIARIKNTGVFRWYLKYFFNRKFRFEEELAATVPQISYLKSQGLDFDINKRAKILSGHLYFWPVSKKEAKRRLENIWANPKDII